MGVREATPSGNPGPRLTIFGWTTFRSGLTARHVAATVAVMNENLGLTSHKSSCNCTGCGMLRAGVCINCAEKIAALILESAPGELAAEPCSGACREAIELYFSTPPERWRAPRAL